MKQNNNTESNRVSLCLDFAVQPQHRAVMWFSGLNVWKQILSLSVFLKWDLLSCVVVNVGLLELCVHSQKKKGCWGSWLEVSGKVYILDLAGSGALLTEMACRCCLQAAAPQQVKCNYAHIRGRARVQAQAHTHRHTHESVWVVRSSPIDESPLLQKLWPVPAATNMWSEYFAFSTEAKSKETSSGKDTHTKHHISQLAVQ